jgi:hypothetical protein
LDTVKLLLFKKRFKMLIVNNIPGNNNNSLLSAPLPLPASPSSGVENDYIYHTFFMWWDKDLILLAAVKGQCLYCKAPWDCHLRGGVE